MMVVVMVRLQVNPGDTPGLLADSSPGVSTLAALGSLSALLDTVLRMGLIWLGCWSEPSIPTSFLELQACRTGSTLKSTRHLESREELEATHPNIALLRTEHPSPSRPQDIELGVLSYSPLILTSHLLAKSLLNRPRKRALLLWLPASGPSTTTSYLIPQHDLLTVRNPVGLSLTQHRQGFCEA